MPTVTLVTNPLNVRLMGIGLNRLANDIDDLDDFRNLGLTGDDLRQMARQMEPIMGLDDDERP